MHADLAEAFDDAGLGAYLNDKSPDAPPPKVKEIIAKRASGLSEAEAKTVDRMVEEADEGKDKDKPETEETDEQKALLAADAAELAEIRKRASARKRKHEETQRARATGAPVVEAKPAEPAKKTEEPATKLTPAEREAAAAVRDVLTQIAAMTEADAAAAASGKPQPGADKRAEELTALREKYEKLSKSLGDNDALTAKLTELDEKITYQASRQIVFDKIDAVLDANDGKFPELSKKRNAVALIYDRADHHYQKTGKAPSLKFVAETMERVLARRAAGESHEDAPTGERQTPTPKVKDSKTVSRNSATPPAARRGPDARSRDEVEKDLFAAMGLKANDYTED